jgi:hypothetical protein
MMHKNSTPNLARSVGEVAVDTHTHTHTHTNIHTHTHTNIHIQNQNIYISVVFETSSKFNMLVSVTDANIFSVNGKEL